MKTQDTTGRLPIDWKKFHEWKKLFMQETLRAAEIKINPPFILHAGSVVWIGEGRVNI